MFVYDIRVNIIEILNRILFDIRRGQRKLLEFTNANTIVSYSIASLRKTHVQL